MKQNFSKKNHLAVRLISTIKNRVNIRVDGNEYNIDQSGGTIPMNVFPSTTVRELRAAVRKKKKNVLFIRKFSIL
jgi:hypothetical protein